MKQIYNVILLTDCFCKVERNRPEIRGTSIRGMIREWKRFIEEPTGNAKPQLGKKELNIERVWGGTGQKSSKVGIAIENCNIPNGTSTSLLVPHKNNTSSECIPGDSEFTLVLSRLVGCNDDLWNEAKNDVENWFLLGCLGQRANRAAGSVWNTQLHFSKIEQLKEELRRKFYGKLSMKISSVGKNSGEEMRKIASNTLKNPKFFGSFSPRKPSPIKMKVVLIGGKYHLLCIAKQKNILDEGIKILETTKMQWKDLYLKNF